MCVNIYIYLCVYLNTFECVVHSVYSYVHIHAHTHSHMYIMRTHTHIYAYIHLYTHTFTQNYKYIYKYHSDHSAKVPRSQFPASPQRNDVTQQPDIIHF